MNQTDSRLGKLGQLRGHTI